jgi:hypothetical protein
MKESNIPSAFNRTASNMTFGSTVPGTSIGSKYIVETYKRNSGIRFTLGLKQGGRLISRNK